MTITRVRDGLYRGSRPTTMEDFKLLSKMGISTVINLEDIKGIVNKEIKQMLNLNILEISIPMGEVFPPEIHQLEYTSKLLSTCRNEYLIYVHCLHGVDRTGAVILSDRVTNCKWSFDKAYKEMLDNGHHVFFYWWWKARLKEFTKKYGKGG
jgi:tyrosine-protein phosphatase SIW14